MSIYVALAALSVWGAIAWNSLFMLIMGGVWAYMACVMVLWFLFVKPLPEDE